MSQQPVWITDEGSLGTVPEGEYYKISLMAVDPEFPDDPTQVTYSLIAGQLPAGVAVQRNGTIEGIPVSIADFKGVPSPVSENVTSKFTIRATTDQGRINDRTFTLTVTGQDVPEFITPPGQIAGYFDGDQVNLQIEISDDDPGDILIMELISGELPPGVILTESGDNIGLLSGYIKPIPDEDSAFVGWDITGGEWDEFPFDFSSRSIDKNYQFTLQITDGKDVSIRTFSIFVYSRDNLTADTTNYTVDNTFITTDIISSRQPFLIEYNPDFGRVRHDNFFAYQFKGQDPDGQNLLYKLYSGTLPETLTIDENTGWLSGYLVYVGLNELEYQFQVQLEVDDSTTTSPAVSIPYTFKFTVVGEVETEIQWLTPRDLGSISNGEISTFYVEAVHKNTDLLYRLKSGLYSKLPQGLQLQESGNIIGRASFKTFSLDNNTTTFDADFETRLEEGAETTFDRTYIFNVEAFSLDGFVSVTKEFVIHLEKDTDVPYNSLYAKAMPPFEDRELINSLISDSEIMVPELLYRTDDPYFGVSTDVTYQHAFGLTPATIEDYFKSFEKNHYKKTVTLGEIKTARALDDNGNILYEVVYSQIIDDMVNNDRESISRIVDLSANAFNYGDGSTLDNEVTEVYPNSFDNMRAEVVDQIGQVSKILPRWMLSKQDDGKILGFTPAWVIAYTKPGQSNLLAYRIATQFTEHLNKVDFTLDRFILDAQLTKDWDLCEESFTITADTIEYEASNINYTTDLQDHNYECNIGWDDGVMTTFDRIPNLLGITVDTTLVTIDSDRSIDPDIIYDTSIGFDAEAYDSVALDIDPPIPDAKPYDPYGIASETIFDGGSCRFISPLDEYLLANEQDKYNKYIMYPQVNITNTIPIKIEDVT